MFAWPGSQIDIRERSPLALAFVGDGVLELMVRARLVAESRVPPGELHRRAVRLVSARAQSASLAALDGVLSDAEKDILRRGRNASKATVSKNATTEEYRASTGLEALLGWLYLRGEEERLTALFELIWQHHIREQDAT